MKQLRLLANLQVFPVRYGNDLATTLPGASNEATLLTLFLPEDRGAVLRLFLPPHTWSPPPLHNMDGRELER